MFSSRGRVVNRSAGCVPRLVVNRMPLLSDSETGSSRASSSTTYTKYPTGVGSTVVLRYANTVLV